MPTRGERAGAQGEVTTVIDGRRLSLSNLDKVMYPADETRKSELLDYYARISPVLLPLLRGRPVTRVRWPHGVQGPSFFEKNLPGGAPSWLPSVTIASNGRNPADAPKRDVVVYPLVNDLAALTYLVNLASLELHVPQWQVDGDGLPRRPDRLVIDLDPGPGAGLRECAHVALAVRGRLTRVGLSLVPVTSGSKGMQLYARVPGEQTSDELRAIAQRIAQELTAAMPDLVVWKMTKSLRPGKVLLDWSQNTAAKTTISPYSLRGKALPYAAAPRTWAEVEAGAEVSPDDEESSDALRQLRMDEVLDRVDQLGDLAVELLPDPSHS